MTTYYLHLSIGGPLDGHRLLWHQPLPILKHALGGDRFAEYRAALQDGAPCVENPPAQYLLGDADYRDLLARVGDRVKLVRIYHASLKVTPHARS